MIYFLSDIDDYILVCFFLDERAETQKKTFAKWINYALQKVSIHNVPCSICVIVLLLALDIVRSEIECRF